MKKVRPENLTAYLHDQRGAQAKIAKCLRIGTSTISQWKSGTRPVPDEYLTTICDILGISEDDLCLPISETLPDNDEMRLILKNLPSLSQEGLNAVLLTVLQQKESSLKR